MIDAGSDSVTAPVDALAVIWFAVPAIEFTKVVATVTTSFPLYNSLPPPAVVTEAF